MKHNNLFIQRRFQVQQEPDSGEVHFIGSLYLSYYFYIKDVLYISKYALCVKVTKSLAELKHTQN